MANNDLTFKVTGTETLDGRVHLRLRAPQGTIITPAMRRVMRPKTERKCHWVEQVIRGNKPNDVTVVLAKGFDPYRQDLATDCVGRTRVVNTLTHMAMRQHSHTPYYYTRKNSGPVVRSSFLFIKL